MIFPGRDSRRWPWPSGSGYASLWGHFRHADQTRRCGLVRGVEGAVVQSAELDLRTGLTALYILMGVAAWMVWSQPASQLRAYALTWFAIQLALNFLWSMIFFRWHAIAGALGEVSFLWLAILATMVMFWEVRPLAGWLLVPYLAWVSFAAALNLGIFRLNRNR